MKNNMAMTPQELQRMDKLEKLVTSLLRAENVEFVKNIERRITVPRHRLADHIDVDVDGVTNGQVIKFTSSTGIWDNANDNV
jgi:hypothetical protein